MKPQSYFLCVFKLLLRHLLSIFPVLRATWCFRASGKRLKEGSFLKSDYGLNVMNWKPINALQRRIFQILAWADVLPLILRQSCIYSLYSNLKMVHGSQKQSAVSPFSDLDNSPQHFKWMLSERNMTSTKLSSEEHLAREGSTDSMISPLSAGCRDYLLLEHTH